LTQVLHLIYLLIWFIRLFIRLFIKLFIRLFILIDCGYFDFIIFWRMFYFNILVIILTWFKIYNIFYDLIIFLIFSLEFIIVCILNMFSSIFSRLDQTGTLSSLLIFIFEWKKTCCTVSIINIWCLIGFGKTIEIFRMLGWPEFIYYVVKLRSRINLGCFSFRARF